MDRELKRLGTYIIGGNGVVMKQEIEEDSDDDNNSKQNNGGSGHPLKSTIVVKKEQQQVDENEVNIGPIIVSSTNRENNKNVEGEVEEETPLHPTKSVVIDGDEEEGNDDNIEDNNNVIGDVAVNTDRNGGLLIFLT